MAQLRSHGSLLLVYSSATLSRTSPLSDRKAAIVLHLGIPGIDAKRPCIFALVPRRVFCVSPPPPLFPPLFTTDSTQQISWSAFQISFHPDWRIDNGFLKRPVRGGGGTHILVQRSSVARVSIGSSGKQIFAQRKHVLEIKSITYLSGVSSLKVRSILAFNFCFDQLFSQLFLRSGSFLSWNNSLNSFNSSSLRFPTVKCACVWLARSMPKTRASTSVACALDDEIIFVGYFLKTKQKN